MVRKRVDKQAHRSEATTFDGSKKRRDLEVVRWDEVGWGWGWWWERVRMFRITLNSQLTVNLK